MIILLNALILLGVFLGLCLLIILIGLSYVWHLKVIEFKHQLTKRFYEERGRLPYDNEELYRYEELVKEEINQMQHNKKGC